MDKAKKIYIYGMILEHEELLDKATEVLNYYEKELKILNSICDVTLSRRLLINAINEIKETIANCNDIIFELRDEYNELIKEREDNE